MLCSTDQLAHPTARLRRSRGGLSYAVATFLILVPFLAALLAALGFAAGITITRLHLPIAVFGAALATYGVASAEGLPRRELLVALGIGLAVLAAALLIAHLSWDFSYDGQAYHQSSVRQLAAGWNPVRHALEPSETTHGLWLNHYVRAAELGAATAASFSGSLEAGKAFGIALVVPAALLCLLALRRAGVRRVPAVVAAIVATANPIVLSQLTTFYIDGELGLLFACSLALGWIALRGYTRTAPVLLGVALAFLANVKFTGTVYAGLVLAGYVVAVLWRGVRRRGRQRRVLVLAPAMLAALFTLALGWQPLVTNAAEHGHPFHPVAGAGRVDGQSGQTPYFRHRDRIRRLLESTFSESASARVVPRPKLPFLVHQRELAAMELSDVRVGGFGPLFALAVVIAVLGMVMLPWSRAGAGTVAGLLVAAGVLATAVINPGAWWARFVPQIWIAAVLASIALATARRFSRLSGIAALAVLGLNAVLVGSSAAWHQVETQVAANDQMHQLARLDREILVPRGEMESIDLRLARGGVRVRYVDRCAPAGEIVGTFTSYCQQGTAEPMRDGPISRQRRRARDPGPG